MTLSERYKNRKILKENDGTTQPPTPAANQDPTEKLEELRVKVKNFGKSIKIQSLQRAFVEAFKEINQSITNRKEINLVDEWNSLEAKVAALTKSLEDVGSLPEYAQEILEKLKKLEDGSSQIENIIKNFDDKSKLDQFFEGLTKIDEEIESILKNQKKLVSLDIDLQRSVQELKKSLGSFVEKFEAQAKLDPAKIIENVDGLIVQSKNLMRKLGKFFEQGNYLTGENKDKTLEDILGGQEAPAAPAAAS